MDIEMILRLLKLELIQAYMQCTNAANRELFMEMANMAGRIADQLKSRETA